MNPFPFVLSDLRRSRGGVAAVVSLIAIAVALGVAVSAQERALRLAGNAAADPFELVIGAPGSPTQLLLSAVYLQPGSVGLVDGRIVNDLLERDSVRLAAPIGFGDSYQGRPIVGTTTAFATLAGERPLAEGRLFASIGEAVVGSRVPLAVGDRFVPTHGLIDAAGDEHDHVEYAVVGRMTEWNGPWDQAILVPIESVWYIHGLGAGHEIGPEFPDGPLGPPWLATVVPGVPAIAVSPRTVRDAYLLRSEFRSRPDTTALFPAEVLLELYALLGDARRVLSVVAVATQLLVIAAVLLAVFAELDRKTRSLGVLRALGAPRGYVFSAVWISVVLMVGAGALLGLAGGQLLARALSAVIAARTALVLRPSLAAGEVRLVAAIVGAGMLLAVLPAVRVYRRPVSALLRD